MDRAAQRSQQSLGATAALRELEMERLRAEQARLQHAREVSELARNIHETSQRRDDADRHASYLGRKVETSQRAIETLTREVGELRERLAFKVPTVDVQVGTFDEAEQTKSPLEEANNRLSRLHDELLHWKSLSQRLEIELRSTERQREELLSSPCLLCEESAKAIGSLRSTCRRLQQQVERLELEAMAQPTHPLPSGQPEEVSRLKSEALKLQHELLVATATLKSQRTEIHDLRGLLAIHMSSPGKRR